MDLIDEFLTLNIDGRMKQIARTMGDVIGIAAEFHKDDTGRFWLYYELYKPYFLTRYIAIVPREFGAKAAALKPRNPQYSVWLSVIGRDALNSAEQWQIYCRNLKQLNDKAGQRRSGIQVGGIDLKSFFKCADTYSA